MPRPNRRTFEWIAAALTFAAAITVFQGSPCESQPIAPPDDEAVEITVTFRNSSTAPGDSVHILGPGETPIPARAPDGNRLILGASRVWTSALDYKVGDPVVFRAIQSGAEIATCTGLVSRSVRDENPRAEVRFTRTGGQPFLNCF